MRENHFLSSKIEKWLLLLIPVTQKVNSQSRSLMVIKNSSDSIWESLLSNCWFNNFWLKLFWHINTFYSLNIFYYLILCHNFHLEYSKIIDYSGIVLDWKKSWEISLFSLFNDNIVSDFDRFWSIESSESKLKSQVAKRKIE